MSYRTFKHLLGETSLERKCRFIFGGGILILVTVSFYLYGHKTETLVIGQSTEAARMLVDPLMSQLHIRAHQDHDLNRLADEIIGVHSIGNQPPKVSYRFLPAPNVASNVPMDDFERETLERFFQAAEADKEYAKAGDPNTRPYVFANGTEKFRVDLHGKPNAYRYIQAIQYKTDCMSCHSFRPNGDGTYTTASVGELFGAIVIELPMDRVKKAIHQNRAILISAALVTAILAMVGSYIIVRYVIVKPVQHLRDVSDAIGAGNLSIRANIHTGDEFEELSHAFNRMLHNLMAYQQELRDVNADLDRKVDELAQANLALYEMNRLKSDFLATMSHELRTPLNSILGFSEVLAGSDQLSEKHRRFANNIMTSGRMLLTMINDILDLAKIESGKMEVRIENCSARDLCESLAAVMRDAFEAKNIDLKCVIDDQLPLIRQDPGKVKRIVSNLLSNAVKFTPEGGRVELRVFAEGRFLVIQVEDTGIGIAPEDQEAIFEKFRQLAQPQRDDAVLTREHQGTGLGLSIVRELCRLLEGDIKLVSQPGLGSIFTVRLPLNLSPRGHFEVNLGDGSVDLSKARYVDPRIPTPVSHAPTPTASPATHTPARTPHAALVTRNLVSPPPLQETS
ncbi:integral membrane sensor signal transduction histidine kinase [Isosphaera pallida ATCC 43644]|uniref:histidine kinase n=1 Tax=Isosphaera pallida (strain ATCC 43644 / DSM 9630 / IS1B) TaxID=575540 RepID=E8R200_ISOPI|nr:ATP-binding protein [Isosphaera pallida]ADV62432.1 integral membrane sensor signal transduction histidine kinase [Isosphaera pallida ATCC 43644]